MRRSSSLPLVAGSQDGSINVFWSEKIKDSVRLERSRPSELPPIPNDDDLERRETPSSAGGRPIQDGMPVETPRSQPPMLQTQGIARETPEPALHVAAPSQGLVPARRSRSPSRKEGVKSIIGKFETPQSWKESKQGASPGEQVGTAIPAQIPEKPKVQVSRADGYEVRPSKPSAQPPDYSADTLEREIERRMLEMMKEENQKLRLQLELMKRSQDSEENEKSFQTAIQRECESPVRGGVKQDEARFTPQGTRVPSEPAPGSPLPPVPPLPIMHPSGEVFDDVADLGLYGGVTQKGKGRGYKRHDPYQVTIGCPPTGLTALQVRTHPPQESAESMHRRLQLEDEVKNLRAMLNHSDVRFHSNNWGPGFHAWPGGVQHPSVEPGPAQHPSVESHSQSPWELPSFGTSSQQWGAPSFSNAWGSPGQSGNDVDAGSQLKSVPITLPKLAQHATLAAGDWIVQLRPYISDICTGADRWWDACLRMVEMRYQHWLAAGPLERIYVEPLSPEDVAQGQPRLEQRVTNLILQSLPECIKSELVSNRMLHVSGALFTVFKRYQPGGVAERSQILVELTKTTPAISPQAALDSLRMWRRQQNRALELKIQLPDPLLLVKALDTIMSTLLRTNAQATFRINSFRMQHQIDVRPSVASIGHLYDLLLSEADQMLYGVTPGPLDDGPENEVAAVKAIGGPPTSPSPKPAVKCRNWGTPEGCRRASSCRFAHDWTGVVDKHLRCWNCSSLQHARNDCPYRAGGEWGQEGTRCRC